MDKFLRFNNSHLITAFSDVIHKLFIKKNLYFDIILYEDFSYRVNDIIDEVLKNNNFTSKILSIYKNTQIKNRQILKPAIIFCDSVFRANEFLKTFSLNRVRDGFPESYKFLFYVHKINNNRLVSSKLHSHVGQIKWFSYFLFNFKGKFNKYQKI